MSSAAQVLLTGASGFIGGHVVRSLERRGFAVVESKQRLDHEDLNQEPVDVVVHLAGISYVPDSWVDPVRFYQTNVIGTLRVLEYCAVTQARMVHVSSYVYGAPAQLPIPEDAARNAINPYMHSKVVSEDCCAFYAESRGVEVLILRPFNVFGPGQDAHFIIPTLIGQLLDPAKTVVTVADGRPRRDFLYVEDLAELVVAAASSKPTGVFNAGSGQSHSIHEVFDLLGRISGIDKPLVETGATRLNDVMDVVANIERAQSLLGWHPTTELEAALRATISAYRSESPA